MNTMNKNKVLITGSIMLSLLTGTVAAFAESEGGNRGVGTTTSTSVNKGQKGKIMKRNISAVGVVTSVSGNMISITVPGRKTESPQTSSTTTVAPVTTITIDATNAKIQKTKGVAGTIADIKVGDRIQFAGTMSPTSTTTIVASIIIDGIPAPTIKKGDDDGLEGTRGAKGAMMNQTIPGYLGTVTALSGNVITINTPKNVTYVVDASAATFTNAGATSTLAQVKIGDNIAVQGTLTGTNIKATSVTDGLTVAMMQGVGGPNGTPAIKGGDDNEQEHDQQPKTGVMGKIGNFFRGIFGGKKED